MKPTPTITSFSDISVIHTVSPKEPWGAWPQEEQRLLGHILHITHFGTTALATVQSQGQD